MAVLRIPFTPIELRIASGRGWSSFEAAAVTNPDGDLARRETNARLAFKSDHLTETFGEEDTTDAFEAPDGKTYYGRFTAGLDGERHVITARQVYARQAFADAKRSSRNAAQLTAQQAVAAAKGSSNGAVVPAAAEVTPA
jgi:hypothetical protein